jgi:hypothetical protein
VAEEDDRLSGVAKSRRVEGVLSAKRALSVVSRQVGGEVV